MSFVKRFRKLSVTKEVVPFTPFTSQPKAPWVWLLSGSLMGYAEHKAVVTQKVDNSKPATSSIASS